MTLKVSKKLAKIIITKSNLPDSDFVINPYTGCSHGCKYCYARFMKRFTGHEEAWGDFVDIKINSKDLIPENLEKYKNKVITFGSVTDPYQEAEKEYQITRSILDKIIDIEAEINILTKSDLVVRDMDILKKFKNLRVAISMANLDNNVIKNFENDSVSPKRRIDAVKKLSENNVYTVLFISPILPYLTDWKEIVKETRNYVSEYWFENLNLYPSIKGLIFKTLSIKYPKLVDRYRDIYTKNNNYWNQEEKNIREFCQNNNIKFSIYFHHGK